MNINCKYYQLILEIFRNDHWRRLNFLANFPRVQQKILGEPENKGLLIFGGPFLRIERSKIGLKIFQVVKV